MSAVTIFRSMRLPFLLLTPVCVFLGASTVFANQSVINIWQLIFVLVGAVSAHISVNTLNEYFDFDSGLDLLTNRTAFSGGSGALPDEPGMKNSVLVTGIVSLLFTIIIGLYFLWLRGYSLLPIGLAGVFLIITYTSWINKHPLLCLVAPGLGFGVLMVVGTQFVLEGEFVLLPFVVASTPFFQVSNLLLLNQFPDIDADRKSGRQHLIIRHGMNAGIFVYGLFIFLAYAVVIVSALSHQIPMLSLIVLITLPLSIYSLSGLMKYRDDIGMYPQYQGVTVAATLLTPMLLGISLIFG